MAVRMVAVWPYMERPLAKLVISVLVVLSVLVLRGKRDLFSVVPILGFVIVFDFGTDLAHFIRSHGVFVWIFVVLFVGQLLIYVVFVQLLFNMAFWY